MPINTHELRDIYCPDDSDTRIAREAADELEGLRAEVEQLRAEADRAAEWKERAEHFWEQSRRDHHEVERLRAIVDKLPKTADGVYVGIGDTVWKFIDDWEQFPVVGTRHGYLVHLGQGIGEDVGACYSSRRAGEVAKGGK